MAGGAQEGGGWGFRGGGGQMGFKKSNNASLDPQYFCITVV